METIAISVRSLVEYVFRSGSIESGFQTHAALIDGTKAHQKVQKQYADTDQKEVPLQMEMQHAGLTYSLEGRCDGLLHTEHATMIDEIKSTARDIHEITEDSHPVHWAQAICYAYMYAKQMDESEMLVQLTYVQVDTEQQKQFQRTLQLGEMESFVSSLLAEYAPYASVRLQHERRRQESIKSLVFPFPAYRDGQRHLAGAVYKSIQEKRSLFAKAPTGIGKTISTLFPSVKAMGEGHVQRIFYLTAKTITRTAAEEAIELMHKQGLCLRSVTLTAKDKVCFKEQAICQKEHCEFADGYYDRINGAVLDILREETMITRTVLEQYARKHRVCPFEFSLDLAYVADAVICDYNYVFDPKVSLKRFFEEQKKHTVLLVDEAHNLPDRARDMFSASLRKSDFLQLKRMMKSEKPLYEALRQLNDEFISIRKREAVVTKDYPEGLPGLLETFVAHAEEALKGEADELLLNTYFAARDFLRTVEFYDERFVTYTVCERSEVTVRLFCLDPSHLLRQMSRNYRTKIYFSATLLPLSYYEDMLGAVPEDFVLSVPSPFRQEQLDVWIQPLSTRYHDRERTKTVIAETLREFIRQGNYLIFFPSYQYLQTVYEEFQTLRPDVRTLVQETNMTEELREQFLAEFQENPKGTLVGFAVLGGIFSEGIDLKGDRLNGVAVIGVGLPQIGPERDIIRDYFQETGKNGYDYAYVFPGMNKVLQAGGRLIRSETDTGSILLIDDRFLQQKYQSLLPEEWRHFTVLHPQRSGNRR